MKNEPTDSPITLEGKDSRTVILLVAVGVLVAAVMATITFRLTSGRKMEVPLPVGIIGVLALGATVGGIFAYGAQHAARTRLSCGATDLR